MEEVMKQAESFVFTTTTADVTSPDDFIVEFLTENPLNEKNDPAIKIKNMDELLDFLEKMEW
jgi:hypothetical protein